MSNLALDTTPAVSATTTSKNTNSGTRGRWTPQEHRIFMQGLSMRPNITWKEISNMVKTRNPRQTRTHAQKYFQKLERRRRKSEKRKIEKKKVNEKAASPTQVENKEIFEENFLPIQPYPGVAEFNIPPVTSDSWSPHNLGVHQQQTQGFSPLPQVYGQTAPSSSELLVMEESWKDSLGELPRKIDWQDHTDVMDVLNDLTAIA